MHKDYLCCQTQASVITSKLDEGDYSLIKLIPEKQMSSCAAEQGVAVHTCFHHFPQSL